MLTQGSQDNLTAVKSEQQVIGGFIISPDLFPKYAPMLKVEDFYYAPHAQIYSKMLEFTKSGKSFDEVILLSSLKNPDEREAILNSADAVTAVSILPDHVELVRKASKSRRIEQGLCDLIDSGDYSTEALQAIIDREQTDGELTEAASAQNIDRFIQNLNKPRRVIKTGFSGLDYALGGGIRRGTLAVIGARPSTGKTTFALNIARNQVENKRRIYFYSLEMTSEMIFERYAADVCNINSRDFLTNSLSSKDVAAVEGLMHAVKEGQHLFVFDDRFTIESIVSDIRANKPDVAIVDYIQRIRSTNESRFFDERTKINYFTSELKIVAKRTNTSIIALSQVVRSGKDSPTMSDLKESGALEEDGDYVMLLHRPYISDKESTEYKPSETEIKLDKNKFGCTCLIDLHFDLAHQRFTEIKNF